MNISKKVTPWRAVILFLGRTDLFSYALIWLMFLVVAGTIAQRNIGLYRAQQVYFSSFIYWAGPIPLPGGYLTLGFVFVGLLCKLVFDTRWHKENMGVIVTHFGAILLLIGGFLTAAFSKEGSMVIPPGETSNSFSDYHDIELALTESLPQGTENVTAIKSSMLKAGSVISTPQLPFKLIIKRLYKNMQPEARTAETPPENEPLKGMAANMILRPIEEVVEEEQNQRGLAFSVKSVDPSKPGTYEGAYLIFENMPVHQTLNVDGRNFVLSLRRSKTVLPFSLSLIQFEKKVYPGTGMAKSYKSTVILNDGPISQRVVIQMNEPLRYKGYTFYQSSFVEHPQGDTTILAVVKNAGRTFPYISSIIMCIGLLIHLLIQSPKLIRKKQVLA